MDSDSHSTSNLMPHMLAQSCPPVHFTVPLFGGMGNSSSGEMGGMSTNSYHGASDQAHIILGGLLLCMVVTWGTYVMEGAKLRTAGQRNIQMMCKMRASHYSPLTPLDNLSFTVQLAGAAFFSCPWVYIYLAGYSGSCTHQVI